MLSPASQTVFILSEEDNIAVDFKKLNRMTDVFLFHVESISDVEPSYGDSESKLLEDYNPFTLQLLDKIIKLNSHNYTKANTKKDKLKVKADGPLAKISGSIKDKVSSLAIIDFNFEIVDEDLDVETFILDNSNWLILNPDVEVAEGILFTTKKIKAKNFLVDHSFAQYYLSVSYELIKLCELLKVEQYGIYYGFRDFQNNILAGGDKTVPYDIMISFTNDGWKLLGKEKENSEAEYVSLTKDSEGAPVEGSELIPYIFANKFVFIGLAYNFDFNVADNTIKTAKEVNLTIDYLINAITPRDIIFKDYSKTLLEKQKVTITKSGNWDGINSPVTTYLTYDSDLYEYVATDIADKITIKPEPIFSNVQVPVDLPNDAYTPSDFSVPPFTLLLITDYDDYQDYLDALELLKAKSDQICPIFDGFPKQLCLNSVRAIIEVQECIGDSSYDANIIDESLSKVPTSSQLLFIHSELNNIQLNLNALPKKMDVIFKYVEDIPMIDETYGIEDVESKLLSHDDKTLKAFKLLNTILSIHTPIISHSKKVKKNNKKIKSSDSPLRIVGNAKDKVSSLALVNTNFEIVESDLNIENLILDNSQLIIYDENLDLDENNPKEITTLKIKTNHLLLDHERSARYLSINMDYVAQH